MRPRFGHPSPSYFPGGHWSAISWSPETDDERKHAQAGLLRDLLGILPFRQDLMSPGWRTSAAFGLARGGDEENKAISLHCLGPGAHACGCFVGDVILGKA
ncbi:hypothetical protein J0H58_10205 [bacterium]|nr:hypothetical protein [bacterium]